MHRAILELAHHIQDGLAIVDGGRIVFVNDRACEILGHNRDELTGLTLNDLAAPEEKGRVRQVFAAAGEAREPLVEVELWSVRKDGTRRFLHTRTSVVYRDGEEVSRYTLFIDITERKQLEDASRSSQRELQQLFEHSLTGFFRTDFSGRIIMVNPSILEIMGYPNMEAMNEVGLPNIYAERFERDRLMELVRNGPVDKFETQVIRADGRVIDIILNIYPIFDDEGKVLHLEGNLIDVTERKQMEEQLRQAEKMQAIGQLAGGIAHDFNNQLAGVLGFTELLRDEVPDNPNVATFTDGIVQAVNRSFDLTSKLLAFSRKGKYLSVPVDMHRIAFEVVDLLKRTIDKNIAIRQRLAAHPSTTLGDPTQLQNALLNLALNARDAMPDGGELTIATDVVGVDEARRRRLRLSADPGRYLQVSVTDSGSGMDEETQRRIFEPFFTTKAPGKGTGMGLAAVYGTARGHGGAVTVSSEVGQGSVFSLFLPSVESAVPEEPGYGDARRLPHGQESAHVLLVDDEETICAVATRMLEKLGCSVTVCRNGAEAVDLYRQLWRSVDLVILDMVMPVMGGREAFLAMREINPEVVAILTSGYSIEGAAQEIMNEGVKVFIQKPYSAARLARTLADLLGPHRRLRQ
jgi:PAS domain S-box-containing protein